jgi:Tfp pilus assembly protein PilN
MSEPLTSTPTPPDPNLPLGAGRLPAPVASADAVPTGDFLNLARRPFHNSRPVVRTAVLLWLLGFALLLGNVSLFWHYLAGSADKRAEIAKGESEFERRQEALHRLEGELDAYNLEARNKMVDFLNEKIGQRTFSWSLLLARLAEILPNDVRLKRLQPATGAKEIGGSQRSRSLRRAAGPNGAIPIAIAGESRNDAATSRFVDNLFAHPAFAYPNLTHEERDKEAGDRIMFELNVQYIPGGSPQVIGAATGAVRQTPPAAVPSPASPPAQRSQKAPLAKTAPRGGKP